MLYQLRYRTWRGMTGKQFMQNLQKNDDKGLTNQATGNIPREQIKNPLVSAVWGTSEHFSLRGEAASLAFTIPSQLNTQRKSLGLSLELSAFLSILLPVQRSVQLLVPTSSYGRRRRLHKSLVPTLTEVLPQLPACLPPGQREMRRASACFLLQTTHLCWHSLTPLPETPVRAPRDAQGSVSSLSHHTQFRATAYKLAQ